jgi:hypothetical protein
MKDLPGKDVNLATQRTANEWTDVVVSCLDELNINIKDMEELDKQYIIDSVSHVKRYYQQLEQELVKTNVTPQDSSTTQSNIKLRF